MLSALRKFCGFINTVYTYVAVVLLIAIIVASALQVFTRYVLNASMIGTEEFARFCFIWMSMLGGSVCVAKGAHPAVTVISDLLRNVPRAVLEILIQLLIILCALIFLYYGGKLLPVTIKSNSPTLGIRMDLVYWSLPVGGAGMILNAVANILGKIMSAGEGRAEA